MSEFPRVSIPPQPELEIHDFGDRLYVTLTQNIEKQLRAALVAYSEWLDADEGLLTEDRDRDVSRTHAELVEDFIKHLLEGDQ